MICADLLGGVGLFFTTVAIGWLAAILALCLLAALRDLFAPRSPRRRYW